MLIIIFIITLSYVLLIGSFVIGFDKVPVLQLKDAVVTTKFSIVIPFRNEAENLPQLLKSIAQLEYPMPLFEILFVDDESTDNSVAIISDFVRQFKFVNISVVKNKRITNSPKKDAITKAIDLAKYDWIVTTDADCELPVYWLDVFDHAIRTTDAKMLVAPVTFNLANSFFERFQLLDILSLQGATIGGFGVGKPFLCNGANLAYTKDIFRSLNGFDGNTDIASGDDIFMLEKAVKRDQSAVLYVKHDQAIVTTTSQPNFKALKSQRVRWAAKTTHYKNAFGKLTGFLVLLMNSLLVCLPLLWLLQVISLKTLAYAFTVKCLIDFLLLFKSARFFGQERYLSSYFFSSLFYPFFNVYIAFTSLFKGYRWKDRAFMK
ncbi:glycosyltransferase family 2 protein [Psychroserpens sp.]|uniref:glycosyltransferase family 2 protein n=1 Tax=Psychroserpens sp. TaxID=2020870 RepID=UPI003C744DBA